VRDKVVKRAAELGLRVDVRRLDRPRRTVHEAAAAIGCQDAQIAKSIVFVADGDPVIVIASGEHRIDTEKLAELLDVAVVRTASEDEVRAATGFSVGGVPPFAHGLPVVLDEALLRHDAVYAAGGDGNSLFEVDPQALVSCTDARVAPIGAV
jgi:prolyl-tRNA editing enzyme YbaK/EbsC (Cys-tRNA(Pro) deacylase)